MPSSILKDFLVKVGYSVDEGSYNSFIGGLTAATARLTSLTAGIAATTAAMSYAVIKAASDMEKLYFASDRTKATAVNLQALYRAAGDVGVSFASMTSSLEGLSNFVRSFPVAERFINTLGVSTRTANGSLRDMSSIFSDLSDKLSKMPFYRAKVYAQRLGINEETLIGMRRGLSSVRHEYQMMARQAGINLNKAAASAHDFMITVRRVGYAFTLLWQSVSTRMMQVLGPMADRLRKDLMDNFDAISRAVSRAAVWFVRIAIFISRLVSTGVDLFKKLNSATHGWLAKLIGLAAVWKLLNLRIMATPIGMLLMLGAAILGLIDDYQTWERGGKSFFDWDKWSPWINRFMLGVRLTIKYIGASADVISSAFDKAVAGVSSAAKFVSNAWTVTFNTIHGLFTQLKSWIENFVKWFDDIWSPIMSAIDKVKGTLSQATSAIAQSDTVKFLSNLFGNGGASINLFPQSPLVSSIQQSPLIDLSRQSPLVTEPLGSRPQYFFTPSSDSSSSSGKKTGDVNLNSNTTIHVLGSSDPKTTADMVAQSQDSVNQNLVRNIQGAVEQ